jgi:hypothetical protein
MFLDRDQEETGQFAEDSFMDEEEETESGEGTHTKFDIFTE